MRVCESEKVCVYKHEGMLRVIKKMSDTKEAGDERRRRTDV